MPARTPLFARVARLIHQAQHSYDAAASRSSAAQVAQTSRREFLARSAATAAMLAPLGRAVSTAGAPRVAIVGAGLAGLVCADRLQAGGIVPTIYEGQATAGGRCRSLRGFFPGQVAELGGEFIDTQHKTMLGLANRFNLPVEDVSKQPGEETFVFGGSHYTEADVIEQYRVFAPRMRVDLKTTSGAPTFYTHSAGDVALDHVDLATYLATRAGDLPLLRSLLTVAYEGEYGLDAAQQSCLNLILFIHADRRSKFQPWGVFSDERYHLIGGNDAIAAGLLADFSGPVEYGRALRALRRNAFGEFELRFASGTPAVADAVVLAIPMGVLRTVELDASLGLSSDKRRAIATVGIGTNAKTMVGFTGVPWLDQHQAVGAFFTDVSGAQTGWETNPAAHGARSILTDYASGTRGRLLRTDRVQQQVTTWLQALDQVWPGVSASAARQGQNVAAVLAHWPSSPWARGSYSCYTPGQFTGIAGLEGERAGHVHFAGEHADSFYSWQGFMEGACLSGRSTAAAILADVKKGRL
jgi:monoamine oxidase